MDPFAQGDVEETVDDECLDERAIAIPLLQPGGQSLESLHGSRRHQQFGRSCPFRLGKTDAETVEAQRLGDLALHCLVDAEPGDPADQLTDEPAEGEGVIAGSAARLPTGLGRAETGDHVVPVEEVFGGAHQPPHLMKACLVGEEVADSDAALAGHRELGPVAGDRIVVGEFAAIDETVHDRCDHSLGRGEAHGHGVALPLVARPVLDAAPRVDDQFTTVVHRHCGAAATFVQPATIEHPAQPLRDRGEIGVDVSLHDRQLAPVSQARRSWPLMSLGTGTPSPPRPSRSGQFARS